MELLKYPNPILTTPCSPVEKDEIDKDFVQFVYDMDQCRRSMKWGIPVGLAANQVGMNARVFIAMGELYINPEVVWTPKEGLIASKEGCYSLADNEFFYVMRPYAVKLKWRDLAWREHEKRFNGFEAAVLGHELDHINGLMCNKAATIMSEKQG